MINLTQSLSAEKFRGFFLFILFLSLPFSIAGDDFATIGLYLVTSYLFLKKEEKWEKTPIIYGMGIFLLATICSSLFSDNPLLSFSYFRNFWRFGLPFLILFALRKRSLNRYLNTLLVISSLVAIYAIFQFFTGLDLFRSAELRGQYQQLLGVWFAVGFFSHHLTYGGVSLLLFSIFTPLVFNREYSVKQRLFWAIGAICNLAAVIVSMGRSIWIGTFVAASVIIFFQIGWKKTLIAVVFFAVLVGSFFSYQSISKQSSFASTALSHRLTTAFSTESNIDRLFMWKAGLNVVKDYPWLGIGARMGDKIIPYYEEISKKKNHTFLHAPSVGVHNIYLQTWIDFGIIGLVGYFVWWLSLLLVILKTIWGQAINLSRDNGLLLGILAGLTGSMAAGFFENNFRDGEVQTTIFVLMGMGLTLLHKRKSTKS